MKAIKVLITLFVVYVLVVVVFESLLGYFQPANEATMVITTTDADAVADDRVLARLETSDGKLYAAANHWPRAWYHNALENPAVRITFDGETIAYNAVSVDDAEHAKVDGEHPLGLVFRALTGFPPRYFVRLDPVG